MTGKTRQHMNIAIVSTVVVMAVIAAIVAVFFLWKPSKNITNFQSCKDAGGAILESYPEQCLLDGKTYVNETQRNTTNDNNYEGLTEQAALDKAKQNNTPARVVERDGEFLPVTMDLVFGRLNLHIKDGTVYKVMIEGEK